jgi:DNA anti-recombination protein RmuC
VRRVEQVGQTIDRELEKLRAYIETELKPTTQRRVLQALRAASKRLAELARELEAGSAKRARPRKRK